MRYFKGYPIYRVVTCAYGGTTGFEAQRKTWRFGKWGSNIGSAFPTAQQAIRYMEAWAGRVIVQEAAP